MEQLLKTLIEKIDNLSQEVEELKEIIQKNQDISISDNWISLKEIANIAGVSYTAVYKKVNNRINPHYIKKINGVLSIPKKYLKNLEYGGKK